MKIIIFTLLLSFLLSAKTYTFSGAYNNTTHKIVKIILSKAYKRAGIPTVFKLENLRDSLIKSNNGTYDGDASRIKTINKKFPNLLIVPVSTLSIKSMAFSKDKNLDIRSYRDLEGKKIAIIKGIVFIENSTQEYKKVYKNSIQEAMLGLENGEYDIVICPKIMALDVIYKKKYSNIKVVSKTLEILKLYHFINKKNRKLIPIITPILQQMHDSGELTYIKQAYLRSITTN